MAARGVRIYKVARAKRRSRIIDRRDACPTIFSEYFSYCPVTVLPYAYAFAARNLVCEGGGGPATKIVGQAFVHVDDARDLFLLAPPYSFNAPTTRGGSA